MRLFEKALAGCCVFVFASCLSNPSSNTYKRLEGKSLRLSDSLVVEIESVRAGLSSINDGGKSFSPIDKSKVIIRVAVSVNNSGDNDYKYYELMRLEMAFSDAGSISFVQRAVLPADKLTVNAKMFRKNTVTSENLYFIHDKGQIPAAMTADRIERVLFVDEDNTEYAAITEYLDKNANIQIMMEMAKETPFEEINVFRTANGIDINDTNRNGYTLLYAAIMFQNDSVLTGAIENGADIHKIIYLDYNELVEPVGFAVLSNNRNAVIALIKAGANLRYPLPIIAVRNNNVPALKLITEFSDIDLTGVMIPMNWSPAIPALKFARDRNMTEMAQYLESLNTASDK